MNDLVKNMESLVPTISDTYYPTFFDDLKDFDLFHKAMAHRLNVKLQGPTGAGKTTSIEAFCAQFNIPHIVVNMKGSTSSEELIGAWVPDENKSGYIWKDGLIPRAIKYSQLFDEVIIKKENNTLVFPTQHYIDLDHKGSLYKEDIISENNNQLVVKQYKPIVLTVEEINFSPEELMSVWFSILDARRNVILGEKNGEVLTAGKNLSVNATMNPDYIGTNKLNRALEDRFGIKINVGYDHKVENNIINELGKKYSFNINDIKFILGFVKQVRSAFKNEGISTNISTRMIRTYMDLKGKVSPAIAYTSLLNSFEELDRDTIKNIMDVVKKNDTVNIDMNDAELEGIDLASFKGFKEPPKVVEKKPTVQASTNSNFTPAPW